MKPETLFAIYKGGQKGVIAGLLLCYLFVIINKCS